MIKIIILIFISYFIGYNRAQDSDEATEALMKLLNDAKEELQYQITMALTAQTNLESRIDVLTGKVSDISSKIDKINVGDNLPKAKKLVIPTDDKEGVCGKWKSFNDEKCFKVLNGEETKSYENATKTCSQFGSDSTLVSISSEEEFTFISKYVFNEKKIVDGVWLGAKRFNSTTFKWGDGSFIAVQADEENEENEMDEEYETNEQNVTKREVRDCLELKRSYDRITSKGESNVVPCHKRNLVLCQKMPNWSLSHLQKSMINAKKVMASLQTRLEDSIAQKKSDNYIEELKSSSTPVGFVYFQLPFQKSPQDIWPSFEWTDASDDYSDLFFRVIGNKSESFEEIQDENFPTISEVKTDYFQNIQSKYDQDDAWNIKCPTKGWSKFFLTGRGVNYFYTNFDVYTRLRFSGGEVRPRNAAIKVWVRTR